MNQEGGGKKINYSKKEWEGMLLVSHGGGKGGGARPYGSKDMRRRLSLQVSDLH